MKVLHAAHLPFWSGGVVQQMVWEQQAADKLGLDWSSRVFIAAGAKLPDSSDPAHTVLVHHQPRSRVLDFRRAYYEWLVEAARSTDIVLLRYSPANPLQLRAVRSLSCKVLFVHHTLEVPELAGTPGFSFKARAALEQLLGGITLGSASGGVAVTEEIAAYEAGRASRGHYETLQYPNGISDARPMPTRDIGEVPRILFVASRFFSWHGLDLLLEAARASNEKFVVDLVGEVEPDDLAACGADARFILHGTRDRSHIADLTRKAWIGITSLALERKGMRQACTLKVREYLGAGLPVYSGHVDVFPAEFPYFLKGDLSMQSILDFAYRAKEFAPATVSDASLVYIDKRQILERMSSELRVRHTPGI